MKIEVGAVIYVIDSARKIVVPVRVNEQITTKKVDGEITTHKVEFPNGKSSVLEKLDVDYFLSVEEVRTHLLSKAEKMIDEGILHAEKVASQKFRTSSNVTPPRASDIMTEEDTMQVTLPDGNVANVNLKIPEEMMNENIGG